MLVVEGAIEQRPLVVELVEDALDLLLLFGRRRGVDGAVLVLVQRVDVALEGRQGRLDDLQNDRRTRVDDKKSMAEISVKIPTLIRLVLSLSSIPFSSPSVFRAPVPFVAISTRRVSVDHLVFLIHRTADRSKKPKSAQTHRISSK